jgi:hypothetical protein
LNAAFGSMSPLQKFLPNLTVMIVALHHFRKSCDRLPIKTLKSQSLAHRKKSRSKRIFATAAGAQQKACISAVVGVGQEVHTRLMMIENMEPQCSGKMHYYEP